MTPNTEQELAEAIASAKGPLRISGGGTRDIGNPVVGEGLSTAKLSGITLYEPGALTGVVAGNISGSRRISVGACRDHMLGVRFVDGRGTVIKNGGRVMKNVTGYDLVKLLAGSYGTLGVLSEVSLKVLPKPETSATLTLQCSDEAQAVDVMSAALGSPFEVTGAAMAVNEAVHLRIEGFEASVAYRAEKLRALLAPFGEVEVQEAEQALWREMRDVTPFVDKDVVVRMSIAPSKLDWSGSGPMQPS